MSTKTELEQEIVSLHRQLAIAKGRHESLKKKVVEVARKGCEEHGWCEEIKDYMRELRLLSYWPSDWVVQYRRRPATLAENDPWGHWDEWNLYQRREDAEENLADARARNGRDSYSEYEFRLAEQTADGKIKVIRGV